MGRLCVPGRGGRFGTNRRNECRQCKQSLAGGGDGGGFQSGVRWQWGNKWYCEGYSGHNKRPRRCRPHGQEGRSRPNIERNGPLAPPRYRGLGIHGIKKMPGCEFRDKPGNGAPSGRWGRGGGGGGGRASLLWAAWTRGMASPSPSPSPSPSSSIERGGPPRGPFRGGGVDIVALPRAKAQDPKSEAQTLRLVLLCDDLGKR